MGKKIYVGNLSYKADESDIKEVFGKIGEVESVKIIREAETGRSKGFGFVEMTSEEDAERAIAALNGTELMERTLTVNEALPQTGRGGSPGGRRPGGPKSSIRNGRREGNWR